MKCGVEKMNKKKELRKLSKKAHRLGKVLGYKRQSYNDLQKTELWRTAKFIFKDLLTDNGKRDLKCCFCKKKIDKYPVLHHTRYDWEHLFLPQNMAFSHKMCHLQYHKKNRGGN